MKLKYDHSIHGHFFVSASVIDRSKLVCKIDPLKIFVNKISKIFLVLLIIASADFIIYLMPVDLLFMRIERKSE